MKRMAWVPEVDPVAKIDGKKAITLATGFTVWHGANPSIGPRGVQLSGALATLHVQSPVVIILGTLSKPRRQRQRERGKTKV